MSAALEQRQAFPLSDVEFRDDGTDGPTFSGYAAIFDSETDLGWVREKIAKGAFTKTLKDGADVRMLINHDGIPIARTKSGNLELRQDAKGLKVLAHLDPANPRVLELSSAMKRGDMDQMSFAFRALKEEIDETDDPPLRTIREAELFDVSVVTYPAYEDTTAELRQQKIELLGSYARSLGLALKNETPPGETPEDPASDPAEPLPEEPVQPSKHSLDLDGARRRIAVRRRKLALTA